MEPEKYQRDKIIKLTGVECSKTNIRINLRTGELKNISHPNKNNDGFDYTENFDGLQTIDTKNIYINLKCIVGKGGSQTRSLREVYNFVEGQLKSLNNKKSDMTNIYFANILDGDEAYTTFEKFNYLLSLDEYKDVKQKIYVGDLKNYFIWWSNIIKSVQ